MEQIVGLPAVPGPAGGNAACGGVAGALVDSRMEGCAFDGLLSVWDGPGQYVQTGSMAGSTQNTPTGGNAYDDE